MKAGLEGEITDKKKSKRKKDGIYYTPSYITEYIVEEAVGNWLEDNPDGLKNIKILDPAGGSGAFPNQVHSYLAKKTADLENQEAIEDGLETLAYQDASTIDKSILNNNIFMVDLQPESVEIAKLSLWLKTARKDQKLNNLDGNVKVGNSLIDDPELAGDKAFDWNKEFEEVIESGGFDVIVGNPPYVTLSLGKKQDKIDPNVLEYYKSKFINSLEYKGNTYALFIEQGFNLLKLGGFLSFIVPNTLLLTSSFAKLRKFLLQNTTIISIVNLKYEVFPDADTGGTTVFVFKKDIARKGHKINIIEISEEENISQIKDRANFESLEQHEFLNIPKYKFISDVSFFNCDSIILLYTRCVYLKL